MNLSTPQYVLPVYLCRFAVRVVLRLSLADFLGSLITGAIGFPRREIHTVKFDSMDTDLPASISASTLFNGDFRRPAAVPLLRLHIARKTSDGILTVSAIGLALRLILRTRLTPG
jgi:hypothetical protein